MNITVYRHEEYNKFIVTIDRGYSVETITLYDISVTELGTFIRELTREG